MPGDQDYFSGPLRLFCPLELRLQYLAEAVLDDEVFVKELDHDRLLSLLLPPLLMLIVFKGETILSLFLGGELPLVSIIFCRYYQAFDDFLISFD